MSLSKSQQVAFNLIKKGYNVFVTGSAGTGKSYLIEQIVKQLGSEEFSIEVTATTGCSAQLIGGRTIHSWSGIGMQRDTEKAKEAANKYANFPWRNTKILIIDEVSMLAKNYFELLDSVAKFVRKSDKPFGGLQIVLVGDFFQLCPVKASFCFKSEKWDEIIHKHVELKEVFRQKDQEFVDLLQEVRLGQISEKHEEMLKSRMVPFTDNEILPTIVYSLKSHAEGANNYFLSMLEKECWVFEAQDRFKMRSTMNFKESQRKACIKFMDKNSRVPRKLYLCKEAQVMLTQNLSVKDGLTNGSKGIVVGFEEKRPVILFDNGMKIILKPTTSFAKYSQSITIIRKQFPIILAWAITTHKSQGMTIKAICADLGNCFTEGQFYTCLSRGESLNSVFVTSYNKNCIRANIDVLEFYKTVKWST